jgi:hypothetical protein
MKYSLPNKKDDQWLLRQEQGVYQSRMDGELARKRKRFRLVDAFSGAVGMTLGFSKSFGHAFDSFVTQYRICLLPPAPKFAAEAPRSIFTSGEPRPQRVWLGTEPFQKKE